MYMQGRPNVKILVGTILWNWGNLAPLVGIGSRKYPNHPFRSRRHCRTCIYDSVVASLVRRYAWLTMNGAEKNVY